MADYTNTRGIFSLLDVRERQAAGVWSTREDVWNAPSPFNVSTPAPFGYFAGGNTPSSNNESSGIDRVDYSNDTATALARGSLNTGRRNLSATGNASFGYFAGGAVPSTTSKVDRIDYSNDTATASPKGPLSDARSELGATSAAANALPTNTGLLTLLFSASDPRDNIVPQGTDFGYYDRGTPATSLQLQRIDFSNDTVTATGRGPTTPEIYRGSAASSASHGYFAGGQDLSLIHI